MLEINIFTPQGVLASKKDLNYITIPGVQGEVGVLPGHMPLITNIDSGILSYTDGKGEMFFAVHHGFAEIYADKVDVCIVVAEKLESIDKQRSLNAYNKAIESMNELLKKGELQESDYSRVQSKIGRALTRMGGNRK